MVEEVSLSERFCPFLNELCHGVKCMAFKWDDKAFGHGRKVPVCRRLEAVRVGDLKW